ncbi:zinc-coordinating transcription factor SFP1 [Aspergillus tanneri]|uniref:Transcriptional regulator of ribosomal bioproteinsis proteins n=1 Tax=Aspergillus tanneri TaxID=1220188 RepID=A0A5M9N336_9EURO|nr:Transcriptional regulator of ribosomal biogenesis proteins [Aspergillus tanneri]KAA8651603.1 Transcriptional regulator of ribosomal bioproteinsis proteins [Aspergillus tanneri]
MTGAAAPIDIATRQTSVSPPGQQASNLTSALQRAGNGERTGSIAHANGVGLSVFKAPPPRKDSIGAAPAHWGNGTKPISVSGASRDKPRRESLAGSLVGGMSWGGISVGSWIRDDILMTGTSPFHIQSPSFHSSSYLPKLEANFMKDFQCCNVTLPTLHDLLQHYEEAHATKSPHQGHRPSQADGRAALAAAAIAQQQSQQNNNQNRGLQPDRSMDMQRKLSQNQPMQPHSDMDTIDDMELDDPMGDADDASSHLFSSASQDNNQGGFGNSNQTVPQLNLSMLPSHQGFKGSQPGTPVASARPLSLQNNPTVSSVNTPTLMANPLQNSQFRTTPDSSTPGTPAELEDGMISPFGDMSMQNNPMMQAQSQFSRFAGANNDMVDLCIDEPAKRLFSPTGGISTPNAHFKLSGAQYGPNSDIARRIREQQLLAGVPDTTALLPNEEPKPFRCPVIGCEKAYKNQNGLKYHKAHGHNNQQLHDNADGTFSIVNPETSTPYPGTLGMEKEKPYRCEVCGKRYKNLNGLKYHKSHSPPCNPDFQLAAGRNMAFGGGVMQGQNINVAGAGLPGIGEEGLL